MNRIRLFIFAVPMILVACHSVSDKDTIAKLRHMQIEIKEEKIEGGLDKAMLSYRRFLEETPDSPLTPEAIRRLADLKIEKEYGTLTEGAEAVRQVTKPLLPAPEPSVRPKDPLVTGEPSDQASANIPVYDESDVEFEKRTTREQDVTGMSAGADGSAEAVDDLDLLFKGALNLMFPGGHLLPGFQADHGHFIAPEANGRASHINGHIPATDNKEFFPESDFFVQGHIPEKPDT